MVVTCDGEYVSVGVKWYAYIGGASTFQKREKKMLGEAELHILNSPSRTFALLLSPLRHTMGPLPHSQIARRAPRTPRQKVSRQVPPSTRPSLAGVVTTGTPASGRHRRSPSGVSVPEGVVPSALGAMIPFVVPLTLSEELEPAACVPLGPFMFGETGVSGLVAECGGSSDVDIARAPCATALAAAGAVVFR